MSRLGIGGADPGLATRAHTLGGAPWCITEASVISGSVRMLVCPAGAKTYCSRSSISASCISASIAALMAPCQGHFTRGGVSGSIGASVLPPVQYLAPKGFPDISVRFDEGRSAPRKSLTRSGPGSILGWDDHFTGLSSSAL